MSADTEGRARAVLGQLITDSGGGEFEARADTALRLVAQAVIAHGKTGEVNLRFKLHRIGESNQVRLEHIVEMSKPTARGKATETDGSETVMYVARDGTVTLFPDTQLKMDYN